MHKLIKWSTFASRRKNQKRNKRRRIAKNRILYLPKEIRKLVRGY